MDGPPARPGTKRATLVHHISGPLVVVRHHGEPTLDRAHGVAPILVGNED